MNILKKEFMNKIAERLVREQIIALHIKEITPQSNEGLFMP